ALLDRLAIVVKVDDRATAGRGGDLERVHANAVRCATVASHDVIRSPDRRHLFRREEVMARDDAPRADEPGRQCEETERGTDRLGPHVPGRCLAASETSSLPASLLQSLRAR